MYNLFTYGRGTPVASEIRNLIIQRVKSGDRIEELAVEFKLYPNTIRKWLAKEGVSGVTSSGRNQRSTALLLAKAEREKQQLMEIIGKLTVQLEQSKKNQNSPPRFAKQLITELPALTRSAICKALGSSRSNTYRISRTEVKDKELADRIRAIRLNNPYYGLKKLKAALEA